MKNPVYLRTSILFVCLHLFVGPVLAQYNINENKQWIFGNGIGLNFTSGSPIQFLSPLYTDEGTASVSDADGNLLFYTEGTNVYNRTGTIMPNGANIVPTSFQTYSTSQAAQVVQKIGTSNQYYIFSMQATLGSMSSDTMYSRLAYSIVDMSLAGGYGDIVSSTKGIVLDSFLSEKQIAIPGNDCNIWLVTQCRDSAKFISYEITESGIGQRVVSRTGVFSGNKQGVLACSPDGRKIATQSAGNLLPIGTPYGTQLFDFDANTGIVSNGIVLGTEDVYGAEFSPDNSKLYSQEAGLLGSRVVQYDVTGTTPAAIIASKTVVTPNLTASGRYFALKLAPNNKIYFNGGIVTIDCFNNPNLAGVACGYTSNVVTLTSPKSNDLGLPSVYCKTDASCELMVKDQEEANEVSLWPNPAHETIFVATPKSTGVVTVTDVSGKNVAEKQVVSTVTSFDITKWPKALYIVSLINDMGVRVAKKLYVH